jgi:hypothetical protein
LAQSLDPATQEALLARVRFYRDLGLTEFYRRPVDPALLAQLAAEAVTPRRNHRFRPASRFPQLQKLPPPFRPLTAPPLSNLFATKSATALVARSTPGATSWFSATATPPRG